MTAERRCEHRPRPENGRWKPEMGIFAPMVVFGSGSGVLSFQMPLVVSAVRFSSQGLESAMKYS